VRISRTVRIFRVFSRRRKNINNIHGLTNNNNTRAPRSRRNPPAASERGFCIILTRARRKTTRPAHERFDSPVFSLTDSPKIYVNTRAYVQQTTPGRRRGDLSFITFRKKKKKEEKKRLINAGKYIINLWRIIYFI